MPKGVPKCLKQKKLAANERFGSLHLKTLRILGIRNETLSKMMCRRDSRASDPGAPVLGLNS